MPASPWRTFGAPDSHGDYFALLSYLPLKSYWRVFPFVFYTAQVNERSNDAKAVQRLFQSFKLS